MKRVLALLAAVSLLAAGCARKQEEAGKAAALVPTNALAYVSVSLDPPSDQKRNLQAICRKFEGIEKEDCGATLVAVEFFESIGLDYDTDVKPWIGKELAFALLPPTKAGGDPLTVLLVEAEDPAAAGDKLRGAGEKGGLDADFKVVENYVVLDGQEGKSNRTGALEKIQAMSTDGKTGLGEDKKFTKVVDKVHEPRLALGWWNVVGTLDVLGDAFPIPGFDEAFRQSRKTGGAGNVAFALYADTDALALEGVTDAEGDTSKFAGAPRLTEGLPPDTLAALTAFGVGSSVAEALREAEQAEDQELADLLNEMRQATGLDLQEDVLSWMDGELVFSVGKLGPEGIPAMALVVEPTDPQKAAAGLAKVKAAVEQSIEGPLAPLPVQGTTAYAVPEAILPGLQPAMGLFADRFVLASSPEYLTALSKPSLPGFGTTAEYHQMVGSSKDKVAFQVVARLAAIRDAVLAILPPEEKPEYDKDVDPWVEPLRALLLRVVPDEGGKFEMKLTTD